MSKFTVKRGSNKKKPWEVEDPKGNFIQNFKSREDARIFCRIQNNEQKRMANQGY